VALADIIRRSDPRHRSHQNRPKAEPPMSIIESLQDFVGENLSVLIPVDRARQPTGCLPDLTAEDWGKQVEAFRESARGLPDDLLVVLVGNMVTEEALPNYSVTIDNSSSIRVRAPTRRRVSG
jgi:hypothetical protein